MALASRKNSATQSAAETPRGESPLLAVVIVNYRQWGNTHRLVGQLLQSEAVDSGIVEIVVVDNNSPFHPVINRLRHTPGVCLRRLPRNRGFARGVNAGCRLSKAQWILLLNPDVTVERGFLDRVARSIENRETDARTGIIGLQLLDTNGTTQGSAGVEPSLASTLLGQLRSRPIRRCRPLRCITPRRVAWVTGCGMLVRRECFEQLGGFDREFFLYFEDVDLCNRARAAGWSVRYEPRLVVTHHSPLHSRTVSPRMRLMTRFAQLTYARKHWDSWSFLALLFIVWTEAVVSKLFAKQSANRTSARAVQAVVIDMWRGNTQSAYRRVWRCAQTRKNPKNQVNFEIRPPALRIAHGSRPLAS